MKRTWITLLFFIAAFLVARAAVSYVLRGADPTGGGTASSSGGAYKLSGALDGCGLPDGYATLSQSSTVRLETGQIPVLNAQPTPNAADPAWLGVARPTLRKGTRP